MLQVVTGTFPCGQQMVKYGYQETAECTLCKKAHEEIRELLREVDGHGKADRHMKLLTIETESRLGTIWDQE